MNPTHTTEHTSSGHGAELSFGEKLKDLMNRVRTVTNAKRDYIRARLLGKKKKVVLSYPDMPARYYHILYGICNRLGYALTNDPNRPADIVIAFKDATVYEPDQKLEELTKTHHVINIGACDITKARVEKVFKEVFGYGMEVDPRTWNGKCVRKSNDNAVHDGKVIDCPAEPEPGYIYQRLIDNQKGDMALDIRVPIFGSDIPLLTIRYKKITDRFDNTLRGDLAEVDDHLSKDEQEKIVEFAHVFGLEYGELDVLRDNVDRKIYIVDANTTSGSPRPGVHMSSSDYRTLLFRMSDAFEKAFASIDQRR